MLLAGLFLSFALASAADALWCGTPVQQSSGLESRGLSNLSTSLIWPQITIDTYFHVIVGNSPGPDDAVSEHELINQFNILNNDFTPSNITFRLRNIDLLLNEAYASGLGLDISPPGMRPLGQHLRIGNFSDLNVYFRRLSNPLNPTEAGRVLSTNWGSVSRDIRKDGVEISLYALPGRAPSGRLQGLGKTLTHEVGHWLGLPHTWSTDSCENDADGIDDTPIHLGPSLNCSAPLDTCPRQPGKDPIHNFMNYVDEHCYKSFTPGQVNHMRSQYERRTHARAVKYKKDHEGDGIVLQNFSELVPAARKSEASPIASLHSKEPSTSKCGNIALKKDCLGIEEPCISDTNGVKESQMDGARSDFEASRCESPQGSRSKPATNKLPWHQGEYYTSGCAKEKKSCQKGDLTDEEWFGTRVFCISFFDEGNAPYESKDACLADRQPEPQQTV
ncbi:hypothetical protein BDV33DRAFT_210312 [Aspergillus novoparasiticus]|uniref:Peptidase M43 pregnancy-associated plasma-A domain-containing protein n=1 Tax=Aspergillus novoparasiticus TaxID=986946 RepID=A0A5N6E7H8_9EURO|nr:hypothetical protein BDV33DRAFT_210312 [Aspergillus novoparasiticus]